MMFDNIKERNNHRFFVGEFHASIVEVTLTRRLVKEEMKEHNLENSKNPHAIYNIQQMPNHASVCLLLLFFYT